MERRFNRLVYLNNASWTEVTLWAARAEERGELDQKAGVFKLNPTDPPPKLDECCFASDLSTLELVDIISFSLNFVVWGRQGCCVCDKHIRDMGELSAIIAFKPVIDEPDGLQFRTGALCEACHLKNWPNWQPGVRDALREKGVEIVDPMSVPAAREFELRYVDHGMLGHITMKVMAAEIKGEPVDLDTKHLYQVVNAARDGLSERPQACLMCYGKIDRFRNAEGIVCFMPKDHAREEGVGMGFTALVCEPCHQKNWPTWLPGVRAALLERMPDNSLVRSLFDRPDAGGGKTPVPPHMNFRT